MSRLREEKTARMLLKNGKFGRVVRRGGILATATLVLSSCGWQGIANVPLPGGPGSGADNMTIYVQMPDTLALNVNSRVRAVSYTHLTLPTILLV